MAYFEDLSSYSYFESPSEADVKNVGWLDAGHEFPRQPPSEQLLDAAWEYCSVIVTPTRGLHDCALCAAAPRPYVRRTFRLLLGSGEIRVFGQPGEAFAAPNLIYHYILDHQNRPPEAFMLAVEHGPRPGSQEYEQLLDRLGVDWRANTPIDAEPRAFRFVSTPQGLVLEEVKRGRE